jgi:HEPN domain-containing protein
MCARKGRSKDWIEQAIHTLGEAKCLFEHDYYDGACFHSQQAAEFALKALHLSLGLEGWGHSLHNLIEELPDVIDVPDDVKQATMGLDVYYTLTRYTNGFEDGSPKDNYTRDTAEEAIGYAETVIEFYKENAGSQGGHPEKAPKVRSSPGR